MAANPNFMPMFSQDNGESSISTLKLPPHSIEAEQSVLGGLLLNNEAWERIGDMVADMQRFDRRADGGDRAGEFVAEHDRRNHLRGAFVPVVDMDVRPADAAGGDLNQDFARGERMLRRRRPWILGRPRR